MFANIAKLAQLPSVSNEENLQYFEYVYLLINKSIFRDKHKTKYLGKSYESKPVAHNYVKTRFKKFNFKQFFAAS